VLFKWNTNYFRLEAELRSKKIFFKISHTPCEEFFGGALSVIPAAPPFLRSSKIVTLQNITKWLIYCHSSSHAMKGTEQT